MTVVEYEAGQLDPGLGQADHQASHHLSRHRIPRQIQTLHQDFKVDTVITFFLLPPNIMGIIVLRITFLVCIMGGAAIGAQQACTVITEGRTYEQRDKVMCRGRFAPKKYLLTVRQAS